MAHNNNNANSTSSSISIHNNITDEELNNIFLLTSPPRKKSKINSITTTSSSSSNNNNNNETTTKTLITRIQPSLSFETIISKTNINNDLNLYLVKNINLNKNNIIELKLISLTNSNFQVACYLYDSWVNCLIEPDYIVNILCEPNQNDGNYHINDKNNSFIIVNPHIILSGTTILSSLGCSRKSALSWKFRDTNGSNSHMLLGNLLHLLFQDAIKKSKFNKSDLNIILSDLIKKKILVNQIFEANIDQDNLIKEAISYLDSIEKWLRDYLKVKPNTLNEKINQNLNKNNNNSNQDFKILNVCDIEESIWSPKYGIKGKLDLTLQIEKHNQFSSKKLSSFKLDTIPVELKSGRSTFSAEHEGQVMLYALLNKEKRKNYDYGLLLYLKDAKMKFIKVNQNNLKGLIQLRNDLVHYISSNSLPSLKNEERYCSKCSLLTVCSLFNENFNKNKIEYETCLDLYKKSISHLNDAQKKYFFKWYRMLDLEFEDLKQFEAGDLIWCKSASELETIGFTVSNLKLIINNKTNNRMPIDNELTSFIPFEFRRDNNNNLSNCQLKENDMVLLSLQNENQIGISQGFIKSISNEKCSYVISFDKNLETLNNQLNLFRIDKINFRSSICSNYTNLVKLMEPTERSEKLRELIIERKKPLFEKSLAKQDILKTKSLFKKLNQNQQLAIIKSMMAYDYLLIKGYPGTGKTSTIAALITILIKLGKKVLFTSYTNSAVDNLLLKLIKEYDEVNFTRIGSFERIHPDIRKYESSILTSKIDNVADLKAFYDDKPLIATTCSSMTHSVFNRIEFDYCIVDEASQVLHTVCLGPLLVSKKFVLVGDVEQLPPIIKNKDARMEGMGISLFEHLDLNENFMELVYQYRMNNEIMDLANILSYEGKLKCISDEVANKKLQFDNKVISAIKKDWLTAVISKSVVFLDTVNISEKNENNDKKNSNQTECEIIKTLCQFFLKYSDCKKVQNIGIIAPYNDQVKHLKASFNSIKNLKDIEINTVDQFQGRDKRIIIVSFTKSDITDEETKEFEILNDKRRLTVSITRAKEKLILVGNSKALLRYKPVAKLIDAVQETSSLFSLSSLSEINNLESI